MSTFKSYKSDAWQDPETNKRYEADAWTDCEFAKRYVSDAWEEVWTAGTYFLKDGVLKNGATLGTNGVQATGSVYGNASSSNSDLQLVRFQLTSDMVGKKIYVNADSNVIVHTSSGGYGYLTLTHPISDYGNSSMWCTSSVNGLLTFDITDTHVSIQRASSIGIGNAKGSTNYHIYDIYVA